MSLFGCKARPVGTAASTAGVPDPQSAPVVESQSATATKIMFNLPYIPWAYTADGCKDRSLLASLELAVAGVPSNVIFATGDFKPKYGEHWKFHVAPYVDAADGKPLIILDPSFATSPLTFNEWIGKLNPQPTEKIYQLKVPAYVSFGNQLDIRLRVINQTENAPVAKMSDMKPFKASVIARSCARLNRFWYGVKESADYKSRQLQLTSRVNELAVMLKEKQLIEGYDPKKPLECDPLMAILSD